MSAPIPILAQLKPEGRHAMALKAAEYDVLRPARLLGQRPIWGDESGLARLGKDDANRQRAQLQKHVQQLRRVASLHRQGKDVELQLVASNVLNSRAAKASALIRFAFSEGRSFTGAQLHERIAKVNVNANCYDPVRLVVQPKDSGPGRPTLDFGWNHRCRQMMLKDVLCAAGVCNEFDHNFRGLGPDRAIRRVIEAIEAGYVWWLTADIKNSFASVKLEHLHGLTPINGAALKRIAFLSDGVPIHGYHGLHDASLAQAARCGLSQGSIVSGPLASALLGREIRALTSELPGVAVTYADDMAIGACTQDQMKAMAHAIRKRFYALSGGPLSLKYLKLSHAVSGFDFIGRRIRGKQWDGVTEIRAQPSVGAFERLKKKLLAEYGGTKGLGEAWGQFPDRPKERIERWAAAMGWKIQPEWWETIMTFCLAY